jgi:nicotinamidase-related amidase
MPALENPAVLLIDVINAFDFEESEALVRSAKQVAPAIEALSVRARRHGIPIIYANDNFGQWRSDFKTTLDACGATDRPGRDVVHRLKPQEGDYFVLKPMHSAFFATPLELVLRDLNVDSLILAGFATDLCVLFSAHDAYMRGFELFVPEDCTASNADHITQRTLYHLRESLGCDTRKSTALELTEFQPSSSSNSTHSANAHEIPLRRP